MTFFLCVVDVLLLCKLADVVQEYLYFKKHGKELDRTTNDGEGDYGF